MKKLFTIIAVGVSSIFAANAQKGNISVGAGIDIGIPLGNFGNAYGVGFGASGKGMYGITEEGQGTLTIGFMRYGMKNSNDYVSGSTVLIPFLPGYRHKFGNLYGEGQLGLTTVRSNIKFKDNEYLTGFGGSSATTNFGYGIGGGLLFDKWDIGARFQGVTSGGGSLDFFAVKVAYIFNITTIN